MYGFLLFLKKKNISNYYGIPYKTVHNLHPHNFTGMDVTFVCGEELNTCYRVKAVDTLDNFCYSFGFCRFNYKHENNNGIYKWADVESVLIQRFCMSDFC